MIFLSSTSKQSRQGTETVGTATSQMIDEEQTAKQPEFSECHSRVTFSYLFWTLPPSECVFVRASVRFSIHKRRKFFIHGFPYYRSQLLCVPSLATVMKCKKKINDARNNTKFKWRVENKPREAEKWKEKKKKNKYGKVSKWEWYWNANGNYVCVRDCVLLDVKKM